MAITATLENIQGNGSLIHGPGGALLHNGFRTPSALLYSPSVYTRITGVCELAQGGDSRTSQSWRHAYSSGYLNLPYGNNMPSGNDLQASVSGVYPPSTLQYAYRSASSTPASFSYVVGRAASSVDFTLPLWFFSYPLDMYWQRYLEDLPNAFCVRIASFTPTYRFVSGTDAHPFSGVALAAAYYEADIDPDGETTEEVFGPAAALRTTFGAARSTVYKDALGNESISAGPVAPDGGIVLRLTDSSLPDGPTSVKSLCVQPWFAEIPIRDGWTGANGFGWSRSMQVYSDGVDGSSLSWPATLELLVPGDVRAYADRYASAYHLS